MLYAASLISNVVAPPLVYVLGLRFSLFLGAFFYAIYMSAFFHLTSWYLYSGAIADGLVSGLMWTAVGQYMTLNSNERTVGRNSSLMYMIIMSGTLWGGVFLVVMFGSKSDRDISLSTQYILYSVFTAVSLLGGLIFLMLPNPPEDRNEKKKLDDDQPRNHWGEVLEELYKSARLVITFDFLLIAIPSAFTGIELSFWVGVYPTSLSFTKSFSMNTNVMIALNCISVGLGELLGGLIFGVFGKKQTSVGRYPFMWLGTALSIVAYIAIWLNIPGPASFEETYEISVIHPNIALALICGFLLGFFDCCINSMIYPYISVQFEGQTKQAFALSKFFHSALSAVCLFYGSVFSIQVQLSILLVGTIISSISYTYGERRYHAKQRRFILESESSGRPLAQTISSISSESFHKL
ncbi:unnamed protein product, partial [Mesorhabditis belari]|uniref:UNC93-like protein MFSD11 n=1 Tax=Mesorhabditis belari TaxID=2138241 RepID=A0AAF3EK26_9BILA